MQQDRHLDVYASRQYGAFSLTQARQAGLSDRMVEGRLETGAWIRLDSGIYALASSPPRWERQLAAAVLSRPESVVAGRSAAFIHGFNGFGPSRPVILVPIDGNARSLIARVIRSRHFSVIETTRVSGFLVTTPAETLVSLAGELTRDRLEEVLDECVAARTVEPEGLMEAITRRSHTKGVATLRSLTEDRLPDAYQPPTSELERILYRLLDRPGIPPVTRQWPFPVDAIDGTVDAFIPRWRLVVEADGRRWHTRKADFDRDRNRDNMATVHGLAVLRFSYRMLTGQPERCLITILETGKQRVRAS